MVIIVNNEVEHFNEDSILLSELLLRKNINTTNSAVAVNKVFINRSKYDTTALHDNDDVIIFSAAYGG